MRTTVLKIGVLTVHVVHVHMFVIVNMFIHDHADMTMMSSLTIILFFSSTMALNSKYLSIQ